MGTLCLIVLVLALVFVVCGSEEAYSSDMTMLFNPPLSSQEKAMLKKIGNDKAKVESFIRTRLFMRQSAAFVAKIPKGVEYKPSIHGCPMPPSAAGGDFVYPENLQEKYEMDYTVTFDEQLLLFTIVTNCSGKKGISNPVGVVACGNPADKETVFAQLTPPIREVEVRFFTRANMCAASEIPKFLATRKYMRQLEKFIAAVPSGYAYDPLKVPQQPKDFAVEYTSADELDTIMNIQQAQVLEIIRRK